MGCRRVTFAVLMLAHAAVTPVQAGTTEQVSVGPRGAEANDLSFTPVISADGRFVAFSSWATNLVPRDTNGLEDVFVRDRRTGQTERVSAGVGGTQPDDGAYAPAISADGRYVAFASGATNLVPGDTNGYPDVFLRDRWTGRTELVSRDADGSQRDVASGGAAISPGGRYVVFDAGNPETGNVFLRDRQAGRTELVSVAAGGSRPGNGRSFLASVSAGGRYVAFFSYATDLAPGRVTGQGDVFVRDRQAGRTELVSGGRGGAPGGGVFPDISDDGRYVAFASRADNLVPGDTNGRYDVFVRDRRTGRTQRVSVGPGGAQGNSDSSNGSNRYSPTITPGGRFVVFESFASNLVPGDTNGRYDVFVRDLVAGKTTRVSVGPGGAQANSDSFPGAVSTGGRFVAFLSFASNLVPGDTNRKYDVFVRAR